MAAEEGGRSDHDGVPEKAHRATVDYFDNHQHNYSRARIRGVAKLLRGSLGPGSSVIDVGCGSGDNLKRLAEALRVTDVTAMDVSAASLEQAALLMPHAQIARASLLDDAAIAPWQGRFDAVVVAAVLHHLVGSTRKRSRLDAQIGLGNAYSLLKPGGLLVVLEPVFTPRAMVASLFWLKRLVTGVTHDRVPVFGYWNNIGAPIVSFYSFEEVKAMVEACGATIVREKVDRKSLGYADRLVSKADSTLIARKPAPSGDH